MRVLAELLSRYADQANRVNQENPGSDKRCPTVRMRLVVEVLKLIRLIRQIRKILVQTKDANELTDAEAHSF
jgi:hypothetical protein